MSLFLHHRETHAQRTMRSLGGTAPALRGGAWIGRGGMRANAVEKNLGDRTPEGAVQS